MGASSSSTGLGMCHPAHAIPDGNAMAGILLSRRSSEARRPRLALLHVVALRPPFRQMGDGKSAGLSHHRLSAAALAFEHGSTGAAASLPTDQAASVAADTASGRTQASREAQGNFSRFARSIRPVDAGDGRLYAARRLHRPRRLAWFMPRHEIDEWRVLADSDHALDR